MMYTWLVWGCAMSGAMAAVPPRPEQLVFPPSSFTVPDARAMRVTLANGIPVYCLEDRQSGLITIRVHFRGGKFLEPSLKEGVAQLAGEVWRTGGAGTLSASALDEELDYLAANVSTDIGMTSGTVSLNLLSKDLDRGLFLLGVMVMQPQFDEARLTTAKEVVLADMKQRNDDSRGLERREWNRLIYGESYWLNQLPTKASVESITRADVAAFYRRLVFPANMVMAVAGDFDRAVIIQKLNAGIGRWSSVGDPVPPVPQPGGSAAPGVYLVNKPDVNQGRVAIGHLGMKRPCLDEYSIEVANDILGGGGFTSRLFTRVRSNEGLAYSVGSGDGLGDVIPGSVRAGFQSKSSTCARAAKIVMEAMKEMRGTVAAESELAMNKSGVIDRFPNLFASAAEVTNRFALDDVIGRAHDYWTRYRDEVRAVTTESVKRAAGAYLKPDRMIVLVVGNIDDILKGHPDHPDARFESFGSVTRLPLRDPFTLQPLK